MPQDEILIKNTEDFVKQAFQKNPHYSFNHWSVMFDHSVNVKNMALKIAEEIDCNKTIVAIGALLHDIGKTHKIDTETLHKDHEKFNLVVSQDFLKSLNLKAEDYNKICAVITYNSDSTEMKVVKDADALALYFDKRLYMLFIEWAVTNKLDAAIKRKIDKFDNLNFEISRNLGREKLEEMKKDWDDYQKNIVD